ncbi:hypothetical protein [Comamonas sp. JC664]|uniref:hypothetical protein n=1 Tax=Comamonas sp. JC664 TaxID=2801917 RepID=UPI001749E34B|nr:hypothetical protein [Comamonas sp. JC664]MBL0695584.1 hypothetical protein [Comamonas sp. JC664]GHG62379.1 hypothetical protein GCM10012319_01000 [Comamonas sp. KCTC 72670]
MTRAVRRRRAVVLSGGMVAFFLLGPEATWALPPPCGPNDPPASCDAKMVALKVQDGRGTTALRVESGSEVHVRWPEWQGTLRVQATREASGAYSVSIGLPGKATPVKRGVLKKEGAAVTLVSGKDVPAGYFGPVGRAVKFILDE